MEPKFNKVHQDTTSLLQELKSIVTAIHESQKRMWRIIDSMRKEVQEVVHGDAGTNGGEETEPMLVLVNLAEEEPALVAEPSIPHYPNL